MYQNARTLSLHENDSLTRIVTPICVIIIIFLACFTTEGLFSVAQEPSIAEVCNPYVLGIVQKYITWLQIAMNHHRPLVMQVLHRFRNLQGLRQPLPKRWERGCSLFSSLPPPVQPLLQCRAQELCHQPPVVWWTKAGAHELEHGSVALPR